MEEFTWQKQLEMKDFEFVPVKVSNSQPSRENQ